VSAGLRPGPGRDTKAERCLNLPSSTIASSFTQRHYPFTMRLVLRAAAVILLLGQVAQWSGAVFCGLVRQADAAHCEDGMAMPAGASLAPAAQDAAGSLCADIGPCRASVPAVTTASAADVLLLNGDLLGPPAPAVRPPSFNPTLITPPPQA